MGWGRGALIPIFSPNYVEEEKKDQGWGPSRRSECPLGSQGIAGYLLSCKTFSGWCHPPHLQLYILPGHIAQWRLLPVSLYPLPHHKQRQEGGEGSWRTGWEAGLRMDSVCIFFSSASLLILCLRGGKRWLPGYPSTTWAWLRRDRKKGQMFWAISLSHKCLSP